MRSAQSDLWTVDRPKEVASWKGVRYTRLKMGWGQEAGSCDGWRLKLEDV